MKVSMPGARDFAVAFDGPEELEAEWTHSLSAGGLRIETSSTLPPFTKVGLTLRVSGGPEVAVPAMVVAPMPGGLALSLEGKPEELKERLLAPGAGEDAPKEGPLWERLRGLNHVEKLMLAQKADRAERAVLLQDSDPQVLLYLLKNPRIGVEEVVRVAKSHLLQYTTAEIILKTPQWAANNDVKAALVHNARLPLAMALRILPNLPDAEIRAIARGAATSQPLKQAALKLVIKS
jgi:hypothetical protein